jgi:hypothetical protein
MLENLANRPPRSVVVAPHAMVGFHSTHSRFPWTLSLSLHNPRTTSSPRITRQPILTPPIIYIYIPLLAKVYYPAHRCRCTHTDSTICLHIGPTAPSLPKWVTMSFKLISILFIPLAITHQSQCGQNMTLVTNIPFSNLPCAVSCDSFGCPLSAYLSSFHPLPVHYMFPYTFNSLHHIVPVVLPICTRRIQHSYSV